jgi:cytochrome c-type biogenesis protein CcmH/NrfF
MHTAIGWFFAIGLVAASSATAVGQASPRQQASDLSRELMSPFCPGKLLSDCTSPDAGTLRDEMRTRIATGEPADAVKADLVRRYGREILGAPAVEGVGLLAWLIPAVLGMGTAAAVAWKVARAAGNPRRGGPVLATAGRVDAAAFARLDDELRDLD